MTFSAQLMNGFWTAFKSLVIFTPHFTAILENCEIAWKTPALLHFRHLEKLARLLESFPPCPVGCHDEACRFPAGPTS
ncbi:hypothetical protein [Rhizobium sp. GR12]|uniref:hypothetical protein n=1 Tax=Rhizobium sp. GR12 TaxID=3053925 RepID=UPI002FBECCF4